MTNAIPNTAPLARPTTAQVAADDSEALPTGLMILFFALGSLLMTVGFVFYLAGQMPH